MKKSTTSQFVACNRRQNEDSNISCQWKLKTTRAEARRPHAPVENGVSVGQGPWPRDLSRKRLGRSAVKREARTLGGAVRPPARKWRTEQRAGWENNCRGRSNRQPEDSKQTPPKLQTEELTGEMNPAKTVLQATETLVARIEDQAETGFNHNLKTQKVRMKEKEASDPTQTELQKEGNITHE
jgi:hypothetical protein